MLPEYTYLEKQDAEVTCCSDRDIDNAGNAERTRIQALQETLLKWKRMSLVCANTVLKLCGSEQSVSSLKRKSLDIGYDYLNYCGPPFWTWRLFKRHAIAFWTAFVVGAVPCILFFSLKNDYQLDDYICTVYGYNQHYQEGYDSPRSSFFQGLLTVDVVWGPLPFWAAKLVDTIWDLAIGRGAQFLSWYLSYLVFSNALLRSMEKSPAPFCTFLSLTLDNCSISGIWGVFGDVARHSTLRHRLLFGWVGLASCYIIALPTILSAMTGYANMTVPFVKMESGKLTALDLFTGSGIESISDAAVWLFLKNETQSLGLTQDYCLLNYEVMPSYNNRTAIWNCELALNWGSIDAPYGPEPRWICQNGTLHVNESVPTSRRARPPPNGYCESCISTVDFTLGGNNLTAKVTDMSNFLRVCEGRCYENTCYDYLDIDSRGTCLPPEGLPVYQWGFSQNLVAIFAVLQFIFTYTLYFIWLDAQLNSAIVSQGYTLGQLRAVLIIAGATQDFSSLDLPKLLSFDNGKLQALVDSKEAVVGVESLG